MQSNRVFFCITLLLHVSLVVGYELEDGTKWIMSAVRETLSLRSSINVVYKDLLLEKSSGDEMSAHRRALLHSSEGDCYWNKKARTCQVNFPVLLDLLDDVDNLVSNYVHKEITCHLIESKESCEDFECLWVDGVGCGATIEEFRDLHTADCMANVSHIADLTIGNLECMASSTKDQCNKEKTCFWSQNACHFDKWYYYHGVNTKDGYPETLDELLNERVHQLTSNIRKASNKGEIVTQADISEWDPPTFNCPKGQSKAVCNYVEAMTPYLLQTLSCGTRNSSECHKDESCTFDRVSRCIPTLSISMHHYQQAELAFAKGLEDPDAKMLEVKIAECTYITDENKCGDQDGCHWLNALGVCTVSRLWGQAEARRLLGKTTDPVCEFFTVDIESGCLEIKDKDKCDADPSCMFIESFEFCTTSLTGQAFYTLSTSEQTSKDLKKANKMCAAAKTKKQCNAFSV